jgi:Uma2 family endonuclease
MADQHQMFAVPALLRDMVATGVAIEDYLATYTTGRYEWVAGMVFRLPPVTARHERLALYLRQILETYFAFKSVGRVRIAPFVLRLDEMFRQPDLQIILNTNPGRLTESMMIGPPDVCIEIVAPGSVVRDYGEKFEVYERVGVGEYWLLDPIRREARFYRARETGFYASAALDSAGCYRTPRLPALALDVAPLWVDDLPPVATVVQTVQAMFEKVNT